ncbi:hypothetical protein JCM6882_001773 [Rhodosporidiobolus microsporus]
MAEPTQESALFERYIFYASEAAKVAREAAFGKQELLDKIQQLESELQVWKLGHQEATAMAKTAQKQLDNGDNIVYCVLDGDGCLFNRSLVSRGRDGGREAAKQLVASITEFAESQGVTGQLTIVINIFLNKYGMAKVFNSCQIADDATFSQFVMGLNSAHSLIQVTDVGAQKEAADAKINQSVRLFSKLASCRLVLAGCAHDSGYVHLFNSLETEAPAQFAKVHLLKGYHQSAMDIQRLNLRTVAFEGLFEPKKLITYAGAGGVPQTPRKISPAPVANGNGAATPVAAVGGFKTPKTVKKAVGGFDKENLAGDSAVKKVKLRSVDPSKPLSKQTPAVCNQHYLHPPCFMGNGCKYGHDYVLSAKDLVQLRQDAKKSPCSNALKGKPCPDDCYAGHVCPFGVKCRYESTCRFSVPGMHPPGTKGRTDGAAWRGAEIGGRVVASKGSAAAEYKYEGDVYGAESDSGFETTSSVD